MRGGGSRGLESSHIENGGGGGEPPHIIYIKQSLAIKRYNTAQKWPSECLRSALRESKISWGACPQTPLADCELLLL